MGSSVIKVEDIVLEKAEELLFMQDQEVIQAFSSHASQKAFTDSICSWRTIRRFQYLDAARAATRAKLGPNLRSLSRMRYVGVCPSGVASRSCCATQRSVGDRVTFTCITLRDFSSMRKKAKSGRKKRSVTCKKSQAHTSAA